MELSPKERAKYICKPHFVGGSVGWRGYYNRYIYLEYMCGRTARLRILQLSSIPSVGRDYRQDFNNQQRFIP